MKNMEETDEAMRYMLERAIAREFRLGLGLAERMVKRWQDEVKAEAWEEGHSASEEEWMHSYDGHPVPEGEVCPECSIGNPYRKEDA